MTNDLDAFLRSRPPTAERPLLGLTVLVVEDSRFACEAMRLLCLRSGARIRRADSLAAARRHLRVYRPSAVIVDLGLPDGSGADLIAELAAATPRVGVLLGISGDPDMQPTADAAGADGFLLKPLTSLGTFQEAVLAHLPADQRPQGPRSISAETIDPDPIALQDDLAHIADILSAASDDRTLDYIAQFLAGVAKSAGDTPLQKAAALLANRRAAGAPIRSDVARVAGLVQSRLEQRQVV